MPDGEGLMRPARTARSGFELSDVVPGVDTSAYATVLHRR